MSYIEISLEEVATRFVEALASLHMQWVDPIYVGLAWGSSLDLWYADLLEKMSDEVFREEFVRLLAPVKFCFVDERVVPLDHEDSNYRAVSEKFFHPLIEAGLIGSDQAIPIDPDVDDPARDYAHKISKMHIALFWSGPDGHIASLFPEDPDNDYLLDREEVTFLNVGNNTKDANARITMTPGMIREIGAAFIFFMWAGKKGAYDNFMDDSVAIDECPAKLTKQARNTFVIQRD